MGVAGMVLGILALIFGFIPLFGAFIAVPCLLVGLPLAGVSFHQNRRRGASNGMALTGMVTSVIALVVTIFWILVFWFGLVAA